MKPRKNAYRCPDCGKYTVTIDVDEGVTPFMLRCRTTPDCNGMATSSFYNPPPGVGEPQWEWFRPSSKQIKRKPKEHRYHYEQGGLDIRRRHPLGEHMTRPALLLATILLTHLDPQKGEPMQTHDDNDAMKSELFQKLKEEMHLKNLEQRAKEMVGTGASEITAGRPGESVLWDEQVGSTIVRKLPTDPDCLRVSLGQVPVQGFNAYLVYRGKRAEVEALLVKALEAIRGSHGT